MPPTVLFICTGNSARSIMAEALLNHLGHGRFAAYSAGSHPTGRVHPHALAVLTQMGVPTAGLRSKSWDEFARPGAPPIDVVLTVCDRAAAEVCPVWPGRPVSAHWGVADPAAVSGSEEEVRAAFERAALRLRQRIARLLALPWDRLDAASRRAQLQRIGND